MVLVTVLHLPLFYTHKFIYIYIKPRNQRNNEFHILGIKFTIPPLLHHHLRRLLFACFTHNILDLALRVGGQRH